jgi:4-amino-4-deoxy-L-arabinose transferase-like glycosyltransferase
MPFCAREALQCVCNATLLGAGLLARYLLNARAVGSVEQDNEGARATDGESARTSVLRLRSSRLVRWFASARVFWSDATRRGLFGLVLVYLSFTAIHNLATKPFLSTPELANAAYALSLSEGRLPRIEDPIPNQRFGAKKSRKGNIQRGAKHPPLYYAFIALPIRLGVDSERVALGVHAARVLTALFGALGLVFVFATVRLLFPQRPELSLATAGVTASVPVVIHGGPLLFNDSLAFACTAIAAYGLSGYLLRGATRGWLLLTALACGAGALSRLSGLLIVPAIALGILLSHALSGAPSRRSWWRGALAASVVAGSTCLIAGWFYVRHALVNGDASGLGELLARRKDRGSFFDAASTFERWTELYDELWTSYAGGSALSGGVELFARALACVGLAGALMGFTRRLSRRNRASTKTALTSLSLALVFFSVVLPIFEYWARGGGAHGRYTVPVLWLFALLITFGIAELFGARVLPTLLGALCLLNVMVLDAHLAQALESSKDLLFAVALRERGVPVAVAPLLLLFLAAGLTLLLESLAELARSRQADLASGSAPDAGDTSGRRLACS